jgi:hypothetical protein
MAYAFDTLGYAKRLRSADISTEHAGAHAEAAREFIVAELMTRNDLEVVRRELDNSILAARRDLTAVIDHQTLKLTVRLGGMVTIAVAVLATIIKL